MYVSIDIETLGTDPETCDIIEVGAVIDDWKSPLDQLPVYHCYIPKSVYRGEPVAMAMHATILKRIADRTPGYSYIPFDAFPFNFRDWLADNGFPSESRNLVPRVDIVAAGKNLATFDLCFLNKNEDFKELINIHRRILDPAILYFDPKTMSLPPNLAECLKLAGYEKNVEHTAVSDALDVIRCLRHKLL